MYLPLTKMLLFRKKYPPTFWQASRFTSAAAIFITATVISPVWAKLGESLSRNDVLQQMAHVSKACLTNDGFFIYTNLHWKVSLHI